ncbi:MAG: preprotein translocase subunit SecG [Clostridia bacterium]|nr:preprotein translocase subunit SecG [Clostridia bacterium]
MRTELESLRDKFQLAYDEAYANGQEAAAWRDSKDSAIQTLVSEMQTPFLIFGIILLCFAAFLIVAIIIQSNKSQKGLSGTITGGSADTFYGRNRGKDKSKILAIITIVVVVLFIIAVLAVYVLQYDLSALTAEKNSLDRLADSYANIAYWQEYYRDSVLSQLATMSGGVPLLTADPLA